MTRFEIAIDTLLNPPPGNVKNAVRQYGLQHTFDGSAVGAAKLLSKVEGVTEVRIYRVETKLESTWRNGEVV